MRRRALFKAVTSVVLSLCFALPAGAQAPPTRPASAPASMPAGQRQVITITEVTGMVQVRRSENAPWEPARVGMRLDEGADFRTGIRSRVRFLIPPDQLVTLDRLGTVKVLRAISEGARVKTDLGMKYGRTQYDVEEAGVEHESTIRSPGATLAVRGTRSMSLYDQGSFAPIAFASQPVRLRDARGRSVPFGRAGRSAVARAGAGGPAETAVEKTLVQSTGAFSGTTAAEDQLTTYLGNFPGVRLEQLGIFSLLARDRNFKGSLAGALPIGEKLLFQLVWIGAPGSNVDILVRSPLGELVGKGLPPARSGGTLQADAIADSTGIGQETIVWPISYPPGQYTITTRLAGGNSAARASVFVTQNPDSPAGKQIGAFTGALTPNAPEATYILDAGSTAAKSKRGRK